MYHQLAFNTRSSNTVCEHLCTPSPLSSLPLPPLISPPSFHTITPLFKKNTPMSTPTPTWPHFTIHPVRTSLDLTATHSLFQSYARWLNLDLSFQSSDSELSTLPGKYSSLPPRNGEILLARLIPSNTPVGCIALRSLELPDHLSTQDSEPACEIKRLYTLPEARGLGIGRALLHEIIVVARERGYKSVWLDSLMSMMAKAVALYEELSFERAERYYETSLDGTVFLRLELT